MFVPHVGDVCPVPPETKLIVMFRNGIYEQTTAQEMDDAIHWKDIFQGIIPDIDNWKIKEYMVIQ